MSGASPMHYKQNRLKQLRAFCHVAQCGSISKAADKLFSSQPAISLQIQALETGIGIRALRASRPAHIHHARRRGPVSPGPAPGGGNGWTRRRASARIAASSTAASSTSPPASRPSFTYFRSSSNASTTTTRESASGCTTSPGVTDSRCCVTTRCTSPWAPCWKKKTT